MGTTTIVYLWAVSIYFFLFQIFTAIIFITIFLRLLYKYMIYRMIKNVKGEFK